MRGCSGALDSGPRKRELGCIVFLAMVALLVAVFANRHAVSDEQWRQAIGPWPWVFPRDHGAHPDFRTEWWYFTGNLVDGSGRRFGYQLTFFRQGITWKPVDPKDPWSIRDLYLGHFTLTEEASKQFWYAERLSRRGPGLAGAGESGMDVWLLNWSAKMADNRIRLEARNGEMELSLELTPRKPPVLHGQNGLSRKGRNQGQASYYASYTDLGTRGTIKTPRFATPLIVFGKSWFDHEFGSNQLAPDQAGWDWFSLHLSDGQDLMIYFLRRTDGTIEPASSGTLVSARGKATNLPLLELSVEVLDRWKSSKSGGTYPSRWLIKVPSAKIDLLISPVVAGQELLTEGSTGVTYWEGAVEGKGTSSGKEVTCEGYVELTGYAGSIGGLF